MPAYINLLENAVIGPYYKRGLDEGELKDELRILRRLIEKRFGAIPSGVEERLAEWPAEELEELSERVLEVASVEALLFCIDIIEDKVLANAFQKGLVDGELKIVRRQIAKSFGAIPDWANERLVACSAAELEELSVRIFDAASIEDFFR